MSVGATWSHGIKDSSSDIHYAFGNKPNYGLGVNALHKRTESDQHGQPHKNVANGFQMAVFFQVYKTGYGACNCAQPHETEESPTPRPDVFHSQQGYGRIRACDVPINCRVVEFSHYRSQVPRRWQCVIDSAGYVTAQHPCEIKGYSCCRPSVVGTHTPYEKHRSHHDAKQNAGGVAPGVNALFVDCITYHFSSMLSLSSWLLPDR